MERPRVSMFRRLAVTAERLYSGVAADRKNGNITITMNRRAVIVSCIVAISTFFGERIHPPFQYRPSRTPSPYHGRLTQ